MVILDLLAYNAGLKPGDIIKKIDDTEIYNYRDFTDALNKYERGSTAKLLIERDGKELMKTIYF